MQADESTPEHPIFSHLHPFRVSHQACPLESNTELYLCISIGVQSDIQILPQTQTTTTKKVFISIEQSY